MKKILLIIFCYFFCLNSAQAWLLPLNSAEAEKLDKLMAIAGQSDWLSEQRPISKDYALKLLTQLNTANSWQEELKEQLINHLNSPAYNYRRFSFFAELNGGYAWSTSKYSQLLGIDAVTNPLLGANEGMFTADGNQAFLAGRFYGNLSKYVSFAAAPYLRLSSHDGIFDEESGASFYLKEGVVTFHLNKLALDVGRASLQWGVGRAGNLLFSADHQPFDLVRLRTARPVVGPWILKYLGPSQFQTFFTMLDKEQDLPHARLVGFNFTFRPDRRFSFSLGQSIIFGGDGAPTNNPLVIFSEKVTDDPNPANRNFLFTARWRLPKLEIEPYLTMMGEDCCTTNPINSRDVMHLAGIYFPRIGLDQRADLAIEWVRTNEIAYRHGNFTSGYTYKQRIIGHPLGPDATGIYAIFRYFYDKDLWGKLLFAFEIRGRLNRTTSSDNREIFVVRDGFETAEHRYRLTAQLSWQLTDKLQILPRLGFERVSHLNYIQQNGTYQALLGFNLNYRF